MSIPPYEKSRLERIRQNQAELAEGRRGGLLPLQDIQKLARSIVYGDKSDAHQRTSTRGDDDDSDPEYQPNAEEEANATDEVARDKEEAIAKGVDGSAMPPLRKRGRSKSTNVHTNTSRSTRARTNNISSGQANQGSETGTSGPGQARNQSPQSTPSTTNTTSPLLTSRDSNSPQGNSDIQVSEGMTDAARQFDNIVTLEGRDALGCSTSLSDPQPSKRGRRKLTMGHGLQDYARRNGGSKMHIDFSMGKMRPTNPVQAAKLSSECGIHIRNKMHVATHWKDYKQDELKNSIPTAINAVAAKFDMDKNDEVAKGVCTNILRKGVRQHRYRLKRDYFKDRTVEEALARKPPNIIMENWEKLVAKWADERFQEICEKNKKNREGVKHHQTTGSRSYVAHFNSLIKEKYDNQEPSPIEFFKDTHTRKKDGTMSDNAQAAYSAMDNKRSQTQLEGAQPMCDTQIVEEVLKEQSASSTFLCSMGYASSSRRSGSSTSSARMRELEERIQQQEREAREASDRYQQELSARLKAQEEMQRKQQEELEAVKKSQQDKIEAFEKKQQEMDLVIAYLLRAQATQQVQTAPPPQPHLCPDLMIHEF